MSIEILERAITRLEQLKDEASEFPWCHQPWGGQNQNGDYSGGEVYFGDGFDRISEVHDADGELIVALSRCVDPILVMLRFARGMAGAQIKGEQAEATVDLGVALAHAVLGESDKR